MIELVRLKPSENFPENDISEDNATILKTLLCDPGIQEYAHDSSERSVTLYKMSHLVLRELIGESTVLSNKGAEWFNNGVVQYEAAASLLRLNDEKPILHRENLVTIPYMTALLKADENASFFDKAHSRLLELPNLCDVFESVTKHTLSSDHNVIQHVLLGAAVQRSIEVDTIHDTIQDQIPGIYEGLGE
jgi:hypothetical protein